jgi:hypothetical protein
MNKTIQSGDIFTYEGKKYFDIKTFAYLTDRTTQTIYRLKDHGNVIRKLNAVVIMGKPMIPIEELTQFPFCEPGVDGYKVVKYCGGYVWPREVTLGEQVG